MFVPIVEIGYPPGPSNNVSAPIVETNNVVKHPEGGCPLQVGEGMSRSSIQLPHLDTVD